MLYNILDVRDVDVFVEGYILDVINILINELLEKLVFFDKEKFYIIICYVGGCFECVS